MDTNSFTPRTGLGVTYDTSAEMAAWLLEHPQETAAYRQSAYDIANMFGDVGDYRGMRKCLDFMVDVFVALAKLRGNKYLE